MILLLMKNDGSWLVIASTLDTAAAAEGVLTDAAGHSVADANNNEIETQDPP